MILWYDMHSQNFILPLFDITIWTFNSQSSIASYSRRVSQPHRWGHVTQGVRQGRHFSAAHLSWESNKWTTRSQGHHENMTAFWNFSVIVPMGQGVMDRSSTWAVCTYLNHFNMNHNPRHEFLLWSCLFAAQYVHVTELFRFKCFSFINCQQSYCVNVLLPGNCWLFCTRRIWKCPQRARSLICRHRPERIEDLCNVTIYGYTSYTCTQLW